MANGTPDTRPPRKGERLTVRFDEGEAARVKARSLAMGVAPSALLRAATLDAVDGGAVPTTIAAAIVQPDSSASLHNDELRRLRTEVNRLGVNFNQLVRKVNSDGVGEVGRDDAVGTLVALGDVLRVVEDLLGGVRRS